MDMGKNNKIIIELCMWKKLCTMPLLSGVSYPAAFPCSFLCIPGLLAGGMVGEAEKSLTQGKHCSATKKTSAFY